VFHNQSVKSRRITRLGTTHKGLIFSPARFLFCQNRIHPTGFHAGGKCGRCICENLLQVREQSGRAGECRAHFQENTPSGDAESAEVIRSVIRYYDTVLPVVFKNISPFLVCAAGSTSLA
jgi:hypothetical protein